MRQRLPMLQKSDARRAALPTADTQALAHELRASIRGEVRFDEGSRALYATDGSNYRQVPIGVVLPRGVEDVIQTVALCRRYAVPLLPRGGGTGLAGQSCNTAVIIDMSKYMRAILEIDPGQKIARVQPGIVLDVLRAAAERSHLTFGPDPATHAQCTLGGMIGNNSCGTHSVMAGKTSENIETLDILTYDGLRLRVGKTSDEELAQIMREGGRRGDIYARLKALETPTPTLSAPASPTYRAAFPAITSTNCCRKTAFTLRARWWAPRVPASPCWRPLCASSPAPPLARCWCSVSPTPTLLPTTSPRLWPTSPLRSRASITSWSRICARRTCIPPKWPSCRKGVDGCWSSSERA